MRRRGKILWAVVGTILVVLVGLGGFAYRNYKIFVGVTEPYEPACSADDTSCAAWAEFRAGHPYPYQSIVAKRVASNTLAIVISEPTPVLPKARLDELVKASFGEDLVASQRLRWSIGSDGWVEDLVLTVKDGQAATADILDDPILRDRIALLSRELFGTTYGADVYPIEEFSKPKTEVAAPNLRISPKELRGWLTDTTMSWHPVGSANGPRVSGEEAMAPGATGAFESSDGALVMLTFPSLLLVNAERNVHALDSLRSPFRQFAVASDAILGGIWTQNGQTAILGRGRTELPTVLPPLRFETFALLGTQSSDELSQSYERGAIFAGKLGTGDYVLKDWAPVFLSEALIDTELGALLNITDQMLKSWSEGGKVEYLYFTYPKPKTFPFNQPLSVILTKESGSESVLFNWNTAGSAVVVRNQGLSVLTARQTGALPVTYGSEAKGDSGLETGKLFKYEEEAYEYFATLRDPNLERVVQYTVLYQLFRAIAGDVVGRSNGARDSLSPKQHGIKARAGSTELMVTETERLLNDLQAGRLTRSQKLFADELEPRLRAFRSQYPEIDNSRLAQILADRFSEAAIRLQQTRRALQEQSIAQLKSESETLQRDIDQYNERVQKAKSDPETDASTVNALQIDRQKLDSRQETLNAKTKAFANAPEEDPTEKIRELLAEIGEQERELDAIRQKFVKANAAEPDGSIKTPSVVLSWRSSQTLSHVGGHNIDARALRLEPSSAVQNIELVKTKNGLVLRYNPSQTEMVEAHATELARAVEHDHVEDSADLARIAAESVPPRSRSVALELSEPAVVSELPGQRWRGRLGTHIYDGKKTFVDDLSVIAGKNDCCVFVAHDEQEVAYVAEKNLKPPPAVLTFEVRDTPSLTDYLGSVSAKAGKKNEKAIVFFDSSEAHVRALTSGMVEEATGPGGIVDFARSLGQRNSGTTSHGLDAIVQRDFRGRLSSLQTIAETVEARGRSLLNRIGILEPKETWRTAHVSVLDVQTTQTFLERAGWDVDRDGVPSAISVSFGRSGAGEPPPDLSVVAGFDPKDIDVGRSRLQAAHKENLAVASENGATVAQYLMTLRNDLQNIPEVQLKRLVIVVQNGETKVLLTLKEQVNEGVS